MSLLIASAVIGLGAAGYKMGAGMQAARRHESEARRAAEQARGYLREDLELQQAAISDQEQQFRAQAIANVQEMNAAQKTLSENAEQIGTNAIMDQAIRGVTGSGTMRAGEKAIAATGREQSLFETKKELAHGSYLSGIRSIERSRYQAGMQADRGVTAINDMKRGAMQAASDTRKSAIVQGGFMALQAGLSYGMGAVDAGSWLGATGAKTAANSANKLGILKQNNKSWISDPINGPFNSGLRFN